jgi:hypothetical protein
MAQSSSPRPRLLLIALALVIGGVGCFLALRRPSGAPSAAPEAGLSSPRPAVAPPASASASPDFDPAYPQWTPTERSEYLKKAAALKGTPRTEFIKSAYRVELDPFMRVEILSYFEDGDLEPGPTQLLSLLVQTEPDAMVREAILMTASTHGDLGKPILDRGLQDGEEDVRVLARELLDEMAEGEVAVPDPRAATGAPAIPGR